MYSYKCITTYNGTKYNGWQKQGNTHNTIQEKLEETISRMLDENVEIAGSGRTDAGVHALNQVFSFKCKKALTDDFVSEINGYLPKDIRIISCESCSDRFHARLNASEKIYQYRIDTSAYGNPFLRDTTHHVPEKLDMDAMKKGAALLIGTHDFKSFCSNKRMKKSSVRTIYDVTFDYSKEQELLSITFRGNGFLYNMVRIMVGTLIEIGLNKRPAESITEALDGCDRALAGHTAPPNGLFLMDVLYE
ncbi:MAG: tRNA pseudouridine(38-40) synthase TruA [Lachnospiraceae bacterium]|nr:tRNA pseudouridine(38-40) synthase TruA [Lachnospiraceae bacterium]